MSSYVGHKALSGVPRQNHRRNKVYRNEASVGKFGEHENGQVKIQQTAFSLSAT
jgi:hypothetical protein